ncbi:MAG: ROK family protein, partial [Acidimicrobiia bacterium]
VDLEDGSIVGDRLRLQTPQPGTPGQIGDVVASLVRDLAYTGPIGIGFPAVVTNDVVWTANNVDRSWVGTDAGELFRSETGSEVAIVNDADAAALCEARYGVARGVSGLVIVLTFGSGIGSGLLVNGELIPNVLSLEVWNWRGTPGPNTTSPPGRGSRRGSRGTSGVRGPIGTSPM